jgi:transcriptional antiterminator RfaH
MAYWAVARLEWRREALGLDSLGRAGFAPYYPRLREYRVRVGRKIAVTVPLFAGYVFIAIELQWHMARWSPGIIGLIMDGERPARVPDSVIVEIRDREQNGLVTLREQPRLRPGDRVKLTGGGPLAGLEGLYSANAPAIVARCCCPC